MACGMGGIRTTGDLVSWVQMAKKLRINEAKAYVAQKLNIGVDSLNDQHVLYQLRRSLGMGTITPMAGDNMGILAKRQIAQLLDIPINSVRVFNDRLADLQKIQDRKAA